MLNRHKIRKLRTSANLSQSDAAKRAGWGKYGAQRWSDIECGQRTRVELKTVEDMAKAISCEASALLK